MKYDVKCHNLGCDAHYEHDDCGSETEPSRCAYCGSTKIEVTEIDEVGPGNNVDSTDFVGEVATSTILLVEELVNKKDFEEINVILAAIDALLPAQDQSKLDMSGLFHGDIKLVADFLKSLDKTTEKFALDYRSWGRALNYYIYEDGHGVESALDIIKNNESNPQQYIEFWEEIRNSVYDCIEE